MINQDKPTTSISNSSRVTSTIANSTKGQLGFLWSVTRFPWLEAQPWLSDGGISNANKPI